MTRLSAFILTTLALSTPAALATATEPAPPPELAKTVAAFSGKTVYDSTITMPGAKPVKAKLTFDCKKTALGKGLVCGLSGTIPGVGPYEGAFLIGYDTFSKAVHFMAITSDEEVHDHVCHWKGDELPCDPLKGGMGGQPITEQLSFSFANKQRAFSSTITFADGGKAVFEALAKR
jgi:hypothetical protein